MLARQWHHPNSGWVGVTEFISGSGTLNASAAVTGPAELKQPSVRWPTSGGQFIGDSGLQPARLMGPCVTYSPSQDIHRVLSRAAVLCHHHCSIHIFKLTLRRPVHCDIISQCAARCGCYLPTCPYAPGLYCSMQTPLKTAASCSYIVSIMEHVDHMHNESHSIMHLVTGHGTWHTVARWHISVTQVGVWVTQRNMPRCNSHRHMDFLCTDDLYLGLLST